MSSMITPQTGAVPGHGRPGTKRLPGGNAEPAELLHCEGHDCRAVPGCLVPLPGYGRRAWRAGDVAEPPGERGTDRDIDEEAKEQRRERRREG